MREKCRTIAPARAWRVPRQRLSFFGTAARCHRRGSRTTAATGHTQRPPHRVRARVVAEQLASHMRARSATDSGHSAVRAAGQQRQRHPIPASDITSSAVGRRECGHSHSGEKKVGNQRGTASDRTGPRRRARCHRWAHEPTARAHSGASSKGADNALRRVDSKAMAKAAMEKHTPYGLTPANRTTKNAIRQTHAHYGNKKTQPSEAELDSPSVPQSGHHTPPLEGSDVCVLVRPRRPARATRGPCVRGTHRLGASGSQGGGWGPPFPPTAAHRRHAQKERAPQQRRRRSMRCGSPQSSARPASPHGGTPPSAPRGRPPGRN